MSFASMLLSICFFFFFQAEDGIRDIGVTGVQTCALPICFLQRVLPPDGVRTEFDLALGWSRSRGLTFRGSAGLDATFPIRSEERRVGKECRSRWSPYH